MEREVFDRMAEQDQIHWWYVARRKILAALIAREVQLPANARILEIGCGTGHNFDMLKTFGQLDALEVDDEARALASKRLGSPVGAAPLPDLPGVPDGHYDLVALLDVLEHVDNRAESLRSIADKLKPNGKILISVPAYQWMWSAHDLAHHHKLRYSKKGLRRDAEAAGLKVVKLGYFNSLLFPIAAAVRLLGKLAGKTSSDDKVPPGPLNAVFEKIFALERHVIGRMPFPAGISLFALLSTR
jgi:2-polyprenyl-3-methyl-5-hydroxy-6-metoxy-1,4-benzoquinol methylase